jgi:hypothetical protein
MHQRRDIYLLPYIAVGGAAIGGLFGLVIWALL